jgi:hypothetical protein
MRATVVFVCGISLVFLRRIIVVKISPSVFGLVVRMIARSFFRENHQEEDKP